MKYRKRPVVIDAIQWTGENQREMWDFLTGRTNDYMSASGDNFYIDHSKIKGGLVIKTLEGEHLASIGDYIIKGVKGEFYPCKPDIFEMTHEPVKEENMKSNSMIGKKVIIRAKEAGVFFGTLAERKGSEVTLTNCRRIWYWKGAASLSQMANEGVKSPKECEFTVTVPKITILGVIEIIPCTEDAIKNIEGVPEWKIQ